MGGSFARVGGDPRQKKIQGPGLYCYKTVGVKLKTLI